MRTPRNDSDYLAQLQDYYARQRCIPAYERLCRLWGLASRSAAAKVLERLRLQDFIERNADGAWVPTRRFFERPLAKQFVQAGQPATDAEAGLSHLLLDELLIDMPSRTLLLKVRGDSMIDANIFENDLVIVERQTQAMPGDIVVALVDGELTVKRLLKDQHGFLLRAENAAYPDIRPQGELTLIGVVTGLARRLRKATT
jgi:repressor LexA